MPILDPALQFSITQKKPNDGQNYKCFYLHFLRIASRNINQNINTVKAYLQFRKDITESQSFIRKYLNYSILKTDLSNPLINNYYIFLYKQIKSNFNEKSSINERGSYHLYEDNNLFTNFFQITLFNDHKNPHSWFFSDDPIAILSINTSIYAHSASSSFFNKSIKLEIDILAASGYTLVLCITDTGCGRSFLFELIQRNQFSEIHYNIITSDDNASGGPENFFKEYEQEYKSCFEHYKGYIYFYANFLYQDRNIPKYFKKTPRIKFMHFSGHFKNICRKGNFLDSKPFLFCKDCFKQKYIRIRLSNIPLYDTCNDDESFTPSDTSGLNFGYILPDDFLNYTGKKIHILYNDNKNQIFHRFINFSDIHKVKLDLYIDDQLALAKVKNSTLLKVKDMQLKINERIMGLNKSSTFTKERIFSILKSQKIRNSLEYVAFAYSYVKYKEGIRFFSHTTQLLTAYQACKKFILRKKDKNEKGVVFQVETGEGKTCIVCLIASALSKMGKTVHVTSSNIKLSIRDYEESFRFFKILDISTALLIHSNELPTFVQKKFNINNAGSKDEKNDSNTKNNNNENKNDVNVGNEATDDKNKDDEKLPTDEINKDDEKSPTDEINKDNEKLSTDDKNDDENNDKKPIYDENEIFEKEKLFFKQNADKYFKYNTQKVEQVLNECYPSKFYNSKLFKNSSQMNFSVCGLIENENESCDMANVIFSTFVNFECLYLKMVELYPGSVEPYFTNCGLLIDEADSMLIDEIANGTIISRSVKSNAGEILKYVYEQKQKYNKTYQETYNLIKSNNKWAMCGDLKEEHIKQMFDEIDIVHKPEYTNGKKYSIETVNIKSEKKRNAILQEILNLSKDIGTTIIKNFVKEFNKDIDKSDEDKNDEDKNDEDKNDEDKKDDDKNDDDKTDEDKKDEDEDEDDDDDDDEDEEEEEEEKNEIEKPTFFNYIVPFGYDRNGMLEPNKEFGGFIQQFIAIKEALDNNVKNMIVNDITMSYLYVSHPIFVNLYGTVCGFTGTIGKKSDKKIFREEYNLSTIKIPRHSPNLSVEFPTIICKNEDERNEKIVSEVIEFHRRGNPVLVIFQNLIEIEKIEDMLSLQGIKSINIFNGKDDYLKPDEIAGSNNSVSLGTNVCGRGTNIKAKGKPLHVIVSYFSSNTRVMSQAFGRTARQGKRGTYRVICTENQFFVPTDVLKDINTAMTEFDIKNLRQREFVDHFKVYRKWIFSNYIKSQKIDDQSIQIMRDAKINVNRIVAYNYIFPICMSTKTFLTIQEQKIFSIFNCPNSQFTWRLFQRYAREMILESWSLMINELDQKYKDRVKGVRYDKDLVFERDRLYGKLAYYFPDCYSGVVETFIYIFKRVLETYEDDVLKGYTKMSNPILQSPLSFFSCKLGFKPYALLSESGARIFSKNFKKTNFIKDPELKYERRTMKRHRFTIASITEKIDDLFNKIFMKVNEILGSKTFLKLFLRRTLAGCEFGFCLNLNIKNNKEHIIKSHPYCIIDTDPLLVFTIFVRSMFPILAIILISVLVYVSSIARKISKWFMFPSNVKESIKTTISIVADAFATNITAKIFEKIIKFLEDNLDENIKQLEKFDCKSANIIKELKKLFTSKKAKDVTKNLATHLGKHFKIKTNWGNLLKSCMDPVILMKMSVFIMLLIASFIMNYRHKKPSLENYKDESEEYLEDKSEKNLEKICVRHNNDFVLMDIEQTPQEELDQIDKEVPGTYLYKMASCNSIKFLVNLNDFRFNKKSIIKSGFCIIKLCTQISTNKKYLQITYKGNKKAFMQQVLIYATNDFPSILKIIGYNIDKNKQHIFLESKEKGTLENFIKRIQQNKEEAIDETKKFIISYGIARALEFLHKHKVVHRNLMPLNIYIDSNCYPYVSDFYMSKHTELNLPYNLKEATAEYMAPEFINDYKSNQNSFKLDVYSYGLTLYFLFTGKKPFYSTNVDEIKSDVVNGKRPEIPSSVPEEWKNLIMTCWNQNPETRPGFTEICNMLETLEFQKRINKKVFEFYRNEFLDKQELAAGSD